VGEAERRPGEGNYAARWGYRNIDVRRYETRRYGSRGRQLNFRLLSWRIRQALRDVPAGGAVLDAPCGTGVLTGMLTSLGLRVTGLDISAAMLAVAAERASDRGYVRADVERLPFAAGTFDAVVCNRFLMHVPGDLRPAVLRELCRVSRGPLVVTLCHPYTLKTFGRSVRRALGLRAKHHERIGMQQIRREVQAAGLRIERVSAVTPLLSEVWVAVLRSGQPRPISPPALGRDRAPLPVA
jgi:SAM-dependent methyltransferase